MKDFTIICAYDKKTRGIGFSNKMVWNCPEDMKFFSSATHQSCVIMGNKTWHSLKCNPLVGRINIVITTYVPVAQCDYGAHVKFVSSFKKALKYAQTTIREIFVIGGTQVYQTAIQHPNCSKLYLSEIDNTHFNYEFDRFFPELPKQFRIASAKQISVRLVMYTYVNMWDKKSPENQYISMIRRIMHDGDERKGRNGIVKSVFGDFNHTFDLRKGFPLLTTKRMHINIIIKELLFFIRGDTNTKKLHNDGVKIWDKNTTRKFLDARGLEHYKIGDMGPMYGFNWRHFGADYKGCDVDYTGKGIDQLMALIHNIKHNPLSRRLMMTTYDPSSVKDSVLPPCHGLTIQFYVSEGYLDCKMYQRSVDTALGYPFNIASYALLLTIIAHVTGLKPRKLYITLGDTHIYEEHFEKITKHLERKPLKMPKLKITKEKSKSVDEVEFMEMLTVDDFLLIDYNYHTGIKMTMIE